MSALTASPGRSYLTGMPVAITVHDDGTVTLTVYAEDIVEAVSDSDDDDIEDAPDEATRLTDAATAGAALTATGTTAHTIRLIPKGA